MLNNKALNQVYHNKARSVWVANIRLATLVAKHTTTGHNIRFPPQTVVSILRATGRCLNTVAPLMSIDILGCQPSIFTTIINLKKTAVLRVSRDQSRHLKCKLEENAPSGQKPVRPDILDLGSRLFAAGQAYVALSRVRSLDGIWIEELDCSKLTGNTPCNSEALNEIMRLRNEFTGQSADRATVKRSDPARWRERGSQSSLGVSTRRCTGPVKKLKFFL
ncbi:hypothetical protein J6590_083717 [Homalodisca vitripennis]|nr:hypothetical protein J6590_083717 [Homalodisca vitripennis]